MFESNQNQMNSCNCQLLSKWKHQRIPSFYFIFFKEGKLVDYSAVTLTHITLCSEKTYT